MLARVTPAALLIGLALVPVPLRAAPEVFGRWQPSFGSCERNLAGGTSGSCAGVLVDQRSAGVYRVSWPGSAGPGVSSVLAFVGVLAGGSEPMACRQAICRLEKPMQIELSSVSQTQFDERGVATGFPSAWPASGRCLLQQSLVRCQARALSGETWLAQAPGPAR